MHELGAVIYRYIVRKTHSLGVIFLVYSLLACTSIPQYTSMDLAALPCEQEANEFFLPLEFNARGEIVYAEQLDAIEDALRRVDQIYVFSHGWDQTTKSAETDYQDLICRFRTHSSPTVDKRNNSIIVGLFWPSAEFPPVLNFWTMKKRVDALAETGFARFLDSLAYTSFQTEKRYKLAFIGHSFGARLVITGLREYLTKIDRAKFTFLSNLDQLQLVLLNAAIGEHAFLPQSYRQMEKEFAEFSDRWVPDFFVRQMKYRYKEEALVNKILVDLDDLKLYWMPSITELASITDLRIYNVMSRHDMADLYLYRLGSIMETGGSTCAIGACGLRQWDNSVKVLRSGRIDIPPNLGQSNVWNVDASEVITAHSDIYKGRVAKFVRDLLDLPRPDVWENPEKDESSIYQNRQTDQKSYVAKDVFDLSRQNNIDAMRQINKLRGMSLADQNSAKRFISLSFDIDHHINHKNWRVAEQYVRDLLEYETCYPGWWLNQNAGVIKPGAFFDGWAKVTTRMRFCGDSLKYLLAYTLVMQNRCHEAVTTLDQMEEKDQDSDQGDKPKQLFPVDRALFCSCVRGPVVVHVGVTWEEIEEYNRRHSIPSPGAIRPVFEDRFKVRTDWPSWLTADN